MINLKIVIKKFCRGKINPAFNSVSLISHPFHLIPYPQFLTSCELNGLEYDFVSIALKFIGIIRGASAPCQTF